MNDLDQVKLGIAKWEQALAAEDPCELMPLMTKLKNEIYRLERENPGLDGNSILDKMAPELLTELQAADERMDIWNKAAIDSLKLSAVKFESNHDPNDLLTMMFAEVKNELLKEELENPQLKAHELLMRMDNRMAKLLPILNQRIDDLQKALDRQNKEVEISLNDAKKLLAKRAALSALTCFVVGLLLPQLSQHPIPQPIRVLANFCGSMVFGVIYYLILHLLLLRSFRKRIAAAKAESVSKPVT